MTLHDVSTQLHYLTGGHINGEHFSKHEFEGAIRRWMRNPEGLKIANRFVIEVELKDGKWLATIDRFADSPDGYDYYIPDTRQQEDRLRKVLVG